MHCTLVDAVTYAKLYVQYGCGALCDANDAACR